MYDHSLYDDDKLRFAKKWFGNGNNTDWNFFGFF